MGSMLGPRRQARAGGLAAARPSCARSARSRRPRSTTCAACRRRCIRRSSRSSGSRAPIDWYLSTVEKQLGIAVSYERAGTAVAGRRDDRHSRLPRAAGGAEQRRAASGADARLGAAALRAAVRSSSRSRITDAAADRGADGPARGRGLGLVAMRERAELRRRHDRVPRRRRTAGRWCG